ncbi:T5orf172 domain-containing protein [Sphingomonas sp. PP-CE-1A-559]|uniref:GIY-YIG nuclease family protein n=1 Tax=Sphingomonas sp. PP-CE-1A-559 TaxID=2135657 RepID=UPI001055E9D2|nr:GIY-YIG nuclease family protein [Sphingomonas sp. PP-CE-1A-559]TCP93739.1 T5orf172 domain-containing protein [Sphingomonas sp. PP-CE-1A-559]
MGIVYIVTNPVMPDLIKIGRTEGAIEERVRSLSSASGVPLPFEVFYAAEVEDAIGWEKALHEAFDDRRVNPRREFFRLSPDKPLAILKMAHATNVTPQFDIADSKEELDALDRERRRDINFSFNGLPIPEGSVLQSVFNDDVTCQVVTSRDVLFRGEICSLSGSALAVAREAGYHWKSIRGPQYWKFEGRTLLELKEAAD